MLGYVIALVFGSFSVVILSSFILFCGWLPVLNRFAFSTKYIYFVYCLFSVGLCILTTQNATLVFQAVAYTIMPMTMLFAPKEESSLFYKKTTDAVFFSLILAVILYLFPTQHYADYLFNRSLIGRNDVRWVTKSLLQGLYGITTLSGLATFCALYYLLNFLNSKKKNGSTILKFVFGWVCVLFAGRRSAIGALFICIMIIEFVLWKNSRISTRAFTLNTLVIFGAILSVWFFYDKLLSIVIRVLDISGALNERNSGWSSTLSEMSYLIIFGKGLGTSGHLASAAGRSGGIHDGQYVLLVVETGIIGMILFTTLIFKALITGKKGLDNFFPFLVVVVVLLQCIGSNVLEMPLLSCLFWYCLSDLVDQNRLSYNDQRL